MKKSRSQSPDFSELFGAWRKKNSEILNPTGNDIVIQEFEELLGSLRDKTNVLQKTLEDLSSRAISEFLKSVCPTAVLAWSELNFQHAGPRILDGLTEAVALFPVHIRIGSLVLGSLSGGEFSIPCVLPLSKRKGLCLVASSGWRPEGLLQTIGLRLACSLPPGAVSLHLIDLASKGRAFSVLGGLDPRIAPEVSGNPQKVTALLKDLEARVSEVTRKCLSRHEWLCEHNAANPDEPEPYQVVLISGYPEGLEPESREAISRILQHECGARAGVYFLISSTGNQGKQRWRGETEPVGS